LAIAELKKGDVKDISLADAGKRKIEWSAQQMPVLEIIRKRFAKEQPLKGLRVSACLHVTSETANLAITLRDGGAQVVLCASNPLSTQDEVAASLNRDFNIPTYAIKGEDNQTYYSHLGAALEHKPQFTMDDGADLVTMLLTKRTDLVPNVIAGTEETTTGVIRLRAGETFTRPALRQHDLRIVEDLVVAVEIHPEKTRGRFRSRIRDHDEQMHGTTRQSAIYFDLAQRGPAGERDLVLADHFSAHRARLRSCAVHVVREKRAQLGRALGEPLLLRRDARAVAHQERIGQRGALGKLRGGWKVSGESCHGEEGGEEGGEECGRLHFSKSSPPGHAGQSAFRRIADRDAAGPRKHAC